MSKPFYEVPEEQACQSRNHRGNRRHIAKGASVDPCERCGKYTCTRCEGTSLFPGVCDGCWRPTLVERAPGDWGQFWEVLEARMDFEESDTRSCRGTCNRLGWKFSRHTSGYWCAERKSALRALPEGGFFVDTVRISAPTAAKLRALVKACSKAMEGPVPAPPAPPVPSEAFEEELPEANPEDVVLLPDNAPADLPANVVPLREHPTLGWEVRLGQVAGSSSSPRPPPRPERRPVWPGAHLTYESLGLFLEWEPMPAPAGEPPAHLVQAVVHEARSRDMARCPVEAQVLAAQAGGRRVPPSYGHCTTCGWAHSLPPPQQAPAEVYPRERVRARRRAAS